MRKMLCFIIIIGVFCCLGFEAHALEQPNISIVPRTTNVVDVDNNIIADVVLENNVEIAGTQLNIIYDSESLEYISGAVVGVFGGSNLTLSGTNIISFNCISSVAVGNGTLFSLTFKAKASTALVKKTSLAITDVVAGNMNGNPVVCANFGLDVAIKNETVISYNSQAYTYDGMQKTLLLSGNLPIGAAVNYTNNIGTDAAVYNSTVTVSFAYDYATIAPIELTATLTINKANITDIVFNGASYTYDELQKTIVITGSLPTGVSVSYTNNIGTNAGTYNSTANISGGTNYNSFVLSAVLTIIKAEQAAANSGEIIINYADETISFNSNLEANLAQDFSGAAVSSGAVIVPSETIYVAYKENVNYNRGAPLKVVIPSRPATPIAPTMLSSSATTITLNVINAAEYKCNNGAWQSSNEFIMLSPEQSYLFYSRIKATSTSFKSESSQSSSISTSSAFVDISNVIVNEQTKTISATFENDTGSTIPSAVVFLSLYNRNNKLIKTVRNEIVNLNNNTSTTLDFSYVATESFSKYKIFVWDSCLTMRPLSLIYNGDYSSHLININNVILNEQSKTITATFENDIGETVASAIAFLSIYNETNKLIETKRITITNLDVNASSTLSFVYTTTESFSKYKIFVWDSCLTMRPLSLIYNGDYPSHLININNVMINEQNKTITATFENDIGETVASAITFLSIYNETNKLIETKRITITNLDVNASSTLSFVYTTTESFSKYKIFVWDNSLTMRPLSNNYEGRK